MNYFPNCAQMHAPLSPRQVMEAVKNISRRTPAQNYIEEYKYKPSLMGGIWFFFLNLSNNIIHNNIIYNNITSHCESPSSAIIVGPNLESDQFTATSLSAPDLNHVLRNELLLSVPRQVRQMPLHLHTSDLDYFRYHPSTRIFRTILVLVLVFHCR